MTSSSVVTGGQQPARHHRLVRPLLGAGIGCLSFALVFTSGYLLGSTDTSEPSVTAAEFSPRADAGLPASGGGDGQAVNSPGDHELQHERKPEGRPARGAPTKGHQTRFVTVEQGDSLWQIASSVAPRADTATTVEQIIRLNSLAESARLEIGQRLAVPVAEDSERAKQPKPDNNPKRPKRHENNGKARPTGPIAAPVSVNIPTLQIQQDLVELNVLSGTLQVPTDYADVGWWRDGPSPGAPGSAVLVGHVDSPTAPAVFYELSSIHIGDQVYIRRADGTKAVFRVTDATLYPRESFPSSRVYREHGRSTLTLVTCGGSYDRAAGYYTDNLVVTARPVHAKRR